MYYFIRERFSPALQVSQVAMMQHYKALADAGSYVPLPETGFRVFSQFEEDGLLLYIFSVIGMDVKTFIEIGADDGVNSNSANLYFHFGWHGLFMDGNAKAVERGRYFYANYPHTWFYKPRFVHAMVTRSNVNKLIASAGFSGEVGLLSIDIDGNDYWIWDAITQVSPRVVIIETHNEFGLQNRVVPYDETYVFPGKHPLYHGASPVAMNKLAKRKGYRLVGANQMGINFIFVRNDLAIGALPEVPVESLLNHPSVKAGQRGFSEIENWLYQEG